MKKEMLINVLQPEECRIAIIEDGVLEELYVERSSQESFVGNIYKGRIVNIEPSIQAAFVDFGIGRNGFLHVSDVDPAYYRHLEPARAERGDRRGDRGDRGGDRDRDRGDRRGGDRGGRRGGGGGGGRGGPRRSGPHQPERTYRRISDEELASEDLAVGGEVPVEEIGEEVEVSVPAAIVLPEVEPELETEPEAEPELEVVEDDYEFGAGLLDGPEPTTPPVVVRVTEKVRVTEVVTVAEPVVEIVEPAPTDSGVLAVTEAGDSGVLEAGDSGVLEATDSGTIPVPEGKPKRKPRAPRKKKEPVVETPPEPEPVVEEPPVKKRRPSTRKKKTDTAEDGPKLMESAERRTDPDDPGVTGPLEEPGFGSGLEVDEDEEADDTEAFADDEEFDDESEEAELDEDDDLVDENEDDDDFDGLDEDFDSYTEDEETGRPERRGGGRDRRPGGRDRRPGGRGGRDGGRPKPLIQDIFKRGQEVIVQVIKEPLGTKGPTLSTYVSIAGRYLVLMPGMSRVGVSRKIADDEQRGRLKDILRELNPPKGLGFIIRTAGMDRDKKELQNDLAYLLRLWQVVVKRIKRLKGPVEIHKESDIITRTIRDTFTADINTIWVDEPNAFQHAQEFLQIVMPRYSDRIKHFDNTEPLFHKYRIEEEIGRIQQKRVELPGGGSIVIEQTEALVAIDVNSGNFRADNSNPEETAFQMNLIAAKEIARQLRLRDLGGVIVNDFIDMSHEEHRRRVEQAMRDAVKRDRARTKILKISQFGLIEMTRQRIRPSLKRSIYQDCPHCRSTGQVKTTESMAIDVMRMMQLAAHMEPVQRIHVRVHADVASYLLNRRRREILQLEDAGEMQVTVTGLPGVSPETLEFLMTDLNGNEVKPMPRDSGNRHRGGHGGHRDRDRDRGYDRRHDGRVPELR